MPPAKQRLLLHSASVVLAVRIALWVLPPRLVLRRVERIVARHAGDSRPLGPEAAQTTWAVTATSRYIPHATCLTQALALQLLLARDGYPSQLHVGVSRGEQGNFQAHAWVEHDGRVMIGGGGLERYVRLPGIERAL